MSKTASMLADAKHFAVTYLKGDTVRKFAGRVKMATIASGVKTAAKILTSNKWWKAVAGLASASALFSYTSTIGISGWLSEKVMNLPANLLQTAAFIVTTPFSVAEAALRGGKTDNLVTVKPYTWLRDNVIAGYKTGTNYIAATYVRAAMNPLMRYSMKVAAAVQAVYAIVWLAQGVALSAALITSASALLLTFVFLMAPMMLLIMVDDASGAFTKTGRAVTRAFRAVFSTIGRAYKATVGKAVTWTVSKFRRVEDVTAEEELITELRANIELLKVENETLTRERDEAMQSAAMWRANAEGLRKQVHRKNNKRQGNKPNRDSERGAKAS